MSSITDRQRSFIQEIAPIAMEQQRLHGIPASVTIAQAAIESDWGRSVSAREDNNFFGIKASSSWISQGKPYKVYADDRPDDKFCCYGSVEESVAHHSLILTGERYRRCRSYGETDYRAWLRGIKACGYATDPRYVEKCERLIEEHGLHEYDSAAAEGKVLDLSRSHYSLPLAGAELVITSNFGHRDSPVAGASSNHKGIDLRADKEPVLSTEDNGKVIKTGSSSSSGNYITIEYDRGEGEKYRISYLHLDHVLVKEGQEVRSGETVAVSGNTGVSTAPHLHMSVRRSAADGTFSGDKGDMMNPLDYLADISVRGNISSHVHEKGKTTDLLAARKEEIEVSPRPSASSGEDRLLSTLTSSDDPVKWLQYLMSENGELAQGGGGLIEKFINGIFMSILTLAARMSSHGEEESGELHPGERHQASYSDQLYNIRRKRDLPDGEAANLSSYHYEENSNIGSQQERELRLG